MAQSIRSLVPGGLARAAALNAGLTPDTGISALIRAAIAMFVTGDINKAVSYTERRHNVKTIGSLTRDGNHWVAGYVNDFDNDLSSMSNKSAAIRTGLAMLAGWDKEDAESELFVPPRGRPRKETMT